MSIAGSDLLRDELVDRFRLRRFEPHSPELRSRVQRESLPRDFTHAGKLLISDHINRTEKSLRSTHCSVRGLVSGLVDAAKSFHWTLFWWVDSAVRFASAWRCRD